MGLIKQEKHCVRSAIEIWGLKGGSTIRQNCLFFLSAGIEVNTNVKRESKIWIVIMLHFLWFQILTFELF